MVVQSFSMQRRFLFFVWSHVQWRKLRQSTIMPPLIWNLRFEVLMQKMWPNKYKSTILASSQVHISCMDLDTTPQFFHSTYISCIKGKMFFPNLIIESTLWTPITYYLYIGEQTEMDKHSWIIITWKFQTDF